jgi:hypothetical protein
MLRQSTWRAHVAAGRVHATLTDGQVVISVTTPMDVPLTGTATGSLYGGVRSGWSRVLPPEVPAPGGSAPPVQGQSGAVASAGVPATARAPGRAAPTRLTIGGLRVIPPRVRFGRPVAVRWALSSGAQVTVTVQRRVGKRYQFVGRLARFAPAGAGALTVKSRLGKRRLVPGAYRLVVTARNGRATTPARVVGFRVLKVRPAVKATTRSSKGAK